MEILNNPIIVFVIIFIVAIILLNWNRIKPPTSPKV